VLALIAGWLNAGVLVGGSVLHPTAGTPQGGVISPLLANIYLNRLDQAWKEKHRLHGEMTRYADLCRIPDKSAYAERLVMPRGDRAGTDSGAWRAA